MSGQLGDLIRIDQVEPKTEVLRPVKVVAIPPLLTQKVLHPTPNICMMTKDFVDNIADVGAGMFAG